MIIRPSFTVLSGAAIGLVAGAAVYGAVSSSATPTVKPTKAVVAVAPATTAHCAEGQKLEDGVCVIHVVRTVVVPAPAPAQVPTTPRAPEATDGANPSTGSSATGSSATGSSASSDVGATLSGDPTKAAVGATKVGEPSGDPTVAADGPEGSTLDNSADQSASDDSTVASH